MENKDEKIDVINVAGNPERKIKTQRQTQVLNTLKEEISRREKTEAEMKTKIAKNRRKNKKKKIRRGMLGIAGIAVLTIGGGYRSSRPQENKENSVTEQEEIDFTTKKEQLEQQKEKLLAFLKDMYIEKLEEISGNVIITTEDIKIITGYENYAFVDTRNRRNYYTWR
ncbi:MAG: hypothetical protein HFJ36_06275 [Clostridia bacterium]|nr:hypothetical protein [Clostridia bacterium]